MAPYTVGDEGGKKNNTWEKWRKAVIGVCPQLMRTIRAENCLQKEELLGCTVRQTHRQTLKHLLHMAQLQQGTRNSSTMQKTGLQNERLFASSLLVALQVSFWSEHASSSGLDSPSIHWVREQGCSKKILGGLVG